MRPERRVMWDIKKNKAKKENNALLYNIMQNYEQNGDPMVFVYAMEKLQSKYERGM